MSGKAEIGSIGWVDMGGYSDHLMSLSQSGKAVAGLCYARGSNADLPPQWLVYIATGTPWEPLHRLISPEGIGSTE